MILPYSARWRARPATPPPRDDESPFPSGVRHNSRVLRSGSLALGTSCSPSSRCLSANNARWRPPSSPRRARRVSGMVQSRGMRSMAVLGWTQPRSGSACGYLPGGARGMNADVGRRTSDVFSAPEPAHERSHEGGEVAAAHELLDLLVGARAEAGGVLLEGVVDRHLHQVLQHAGIADGGLRGGRGDGDAADGEVALQAHHHRAAAGLAFEARVGALVFGLLHGVLDRAEAAHQGVEVHGVLRRGWWGGRVVVAGGCGRGLPGAPNGVFGSATHVLFPGWRRRRWSPAGASTVC